MNKSLLFMLCLIPVLAWAERGDLPVRTSGLFVGGAVGIGAVEIKTDQGKIDDTDTGYKLFTGYRWWNTPIPWDIDLGFELAWVDLGEREAVLDDGDNLEISNDIWKSTTDGFSTTVSGYLPLRRNWELIGKAGLYFSETTLINLNVPIEPGSDDSTDLILGIGIGYQGARGFGVRAEIESYGVMDGGFLWSLSGTYQFK
jgi:hypothetical protein